LYERLGGKEAITAVVDDFVNRGAADPKVNFSRQGVPGAQAWQATPDNIAKVKQRIAEFVVMAAGGPKTYEGETMKVSHSGMKITDAEFDALAADLRASLEKFKVPKKEADELMAVVGTTRKDIVEKRAGGQ
jgi:hemoglobin